VRTAVAEKIGLNVSRLVAKTEKFIPKTISGKIWRRATRTVLHNDKIKIVFEQINTSNVPKPSVAIADRKNSTDRFDAIMLDAFGNKFSPE
jgi:hypothetical protein